MYKNWKSKVKMTAFDLSISILAEEQYLGDRGSLFVVVVLFLLLLFEVGY